MQELEKILEELKRIKDGNRKEKLYAKYPPNSKDQEVLNAYSQGYEDGTDNFYNAAVGIIRKHMNDGWIPVEERLPKEPHEGVDEDDLEEYIVMIDGAERPATLKYAGNGQWLETGNWREDVTYYSVVAWQPLPGPYRPERSEEE